MGQVDRGVTTNPAILEVPYRWHDWLLAIGVALLLLLHASIYADQTPVGAAPDEFAHLTYVHEVAQEGAWAPDYAGSLILPSRVIPNYLTHPPLYYSVLGFVGKWAGWDALEDAAKFRRLSMAMVALGMLLWAMTARGLGLSWWWTLPLCLSVNAVPMFAYLAGSLNNDAMCYLAVALGVFGLVNTRRWPRLAWYLGACGLAMAMLTKATAALFLLILFASWLVHETRLSPHADLLRNRHFLRAVGLAAVPVAAYYVWAMLNFGTPFPHAGDIRPHASPTGDVQGIASIAWQFVTELGKRFAVIGGSQARTIPLSGMMGNALLLTFALPVLALCRSQFTRHRDARDWIVTAFALALVGTLLAHFVFVVREYHAVGEVVGLHPRYYYAYLLPGLVVMACVDRSRVARGLMAIFCAAVCAWLLVVPYRTQQAEHERHHPRATVAFPDDLAVTNASARIRLSPGRNLAGHLDQLSLQDGTLAVSGWAIDVVSKSSARRVKLYFDGRELGSTSPGRMRPDVAKALGSAPAEQSGFSLRVTNVPANLRVCDLQVIVEQDDGSNAQIGHPSCDLQGE